MRWIDRVRQDAATLKTLEGGKKKRQFLWDYYKLPIGAVLCAAALMVLTMTLNLGRGDNVMYAVLVNASDTGEKQVFTTLLEEAGVDMAGKEGDVAAS